MYILISQLREFGLGEKVGGCWSSWGKNPTAALGKQFNQISQWSALGLFPVNFFFGGWALEEAK